MIDRRPKGYFTGRIRSVWDGSAYSRRFRQYFPATTVFDVPSLSAKEVLELFQQHEADENCETALLPADSAWRKWLAYNVEPLFPEAMEVRHSTTAAATSSTASSPSVKSSAATSYLFGMHPHGLFGFGVWSTWVFSPSSVRQVFRQFTVTAHTLSVNFRIPLWREFLLSLGFCDVSRSTLVRLLAAPSSPRSGMVKSRKPAVCVLVPGGAAESVHCTEPRLTLLNRKGFVRVAITTGSALVPCFTFGETDLYVPLLSHQGRTTAMGILRWLQKRLGVGTPIVCGRGVFNYVAGPLPRRGRLTTVIGQPIATVGCNACDVDRLHGQYVAAVRALYAKYQALLDPRQVHRDLVVE